MKNVLLPANASSDTCFMKVFQDIFSIRKEIKSIKQLPKSTGLVPTMGALHNGHFSLINAAIKENGKHMAIIIVQCAFLRKIINNIEANSNP